MEIGQVYPHIKNAMKQSDYDTRLNETNAIKTANVFAKRSIFKSTCNKRCKGTSLTDRQRQNYQM